MLGEMLIMVSGQFKNDKCHLMSVLDIIQTLTAHQIGIKIHVRKVARHSETIFCSFGLLLSDCSSIISSKVVVIWRLFLSVFLHFQVIYLSGIPLYWWIRRTENIPFWISSSTKIKWAGRSSVATKFLHCWNSECIVSRKALLDLLFAV